MQAFKSLNGRVLPIDRANIDTDAIIPKQFLKSIKRSGFGPNLFDEWRYLDKGEPGMDCSNRPLNKDFVLNQPRYQGAEVLLARNNFGCGSSREHAPWALLDYGIRCVIAPSFADIFYNNCFKNGILPLTLPEDIVDGLFSEIKAYEGVKDFAGFNLSVDLESQLVTTPDGTRHGFEVDAFKKHCLLNGLDDIGLTLQHADDIKAFEQSYKERASWLFSS